MMPNRPPIVTPGVWTYPSLAFPSCGAATHVSIAIMAVGERGRRLPLRLATLLTLFASLGLTAGAVWATHAGVHDQSERLLKERTAEINIVLTQAIDVI